MRVLVVANSVLSKEESNGRIARSLLGGFSDQELSCFGLRGIPNCPNVDYQMVTDRDALKSFLSFGIVKPKGVQAAKLLNDNNRRSGSSPLKHILRDVVWFSGFWRCKRIRQWEKNLDISTVFLMAADAPFLFRYAVKMAKKKRIPLVIYSSEDYPLKRYDYIAKKTKMSLGCRLFLNKLRKEAKKAFEFARTSVFVCEKLKKDFESFFNLQSALIVRQPSTIHPISGSMTPNSRAKVIYGGNLFKERLMPLLEIADVIHRIDRTAKLELFGPLTDSWSLEKVNASQDLISYNGIIPYGDLQKEYRSASLLVHAEGFDEYHRLDYAHAFSTKIGDCYMSGIPFFLYGPPDIPCIEFGMEFCPEFTATSKEEMEEKLSKILQGVVAYPLRPFDTKKEFGQEEVGQAIRKIIENAASSYFEK